MWSYLTSSIIKSTNYSVINVDNTYKFNIVTMETLSEEQKKKFIENMKLHMGLTYYEDFRMYICRKMPKSELLTYFD